MARRRRQENLVVKAATAELLQSRGKLKKQITMKPPLAREREYRMAIIKIMQRARAIARALFIEKLPQIQKTALDSIVVDGYGDDIEKAMQQVRLRFTTEIPDETIEAVAAKAGRQVEMFSATQVNRTFESAIGVPVSSLFADVDDAIEAFTKDNVALIKSLPETYFKEIETTALRNFRSGKRFSEWAPELQKRFDISKNRAALIARDQTNKFNGELNKKRQTDLGVRTYIWRTVGDERVRPTHEAIDGDPFAWEGEPAPPEGHPGEPINCRCSAEPDIESVLTKTERRNL